MWSRTLKNDKANTVKLGGCGGSGLAPESQTELNLEYQATQDYFLSKNNNDKQKYPPNKG